MRDRRRLLLLYRRAFGGVQALHPFPDGCNDFNESTADGCVNHNCVYDLLSDTPCDGDANPCTNDASPTTVPESARA